MKQQSLLTVSEFRQLSKATVKKKQKKDEARLQVRICNYLKLKYPDVIFDCDLASGMNLGKFIGGMNTRLRSSRALPDLNIWEAKGKYHGFRMELKKEGVKIFTNSSELVADKHIREQYEMSERLKKKGYFSCFGIGYEHAISMIEYYFSLK